MIRKKTVIYGSTALQQQLPQLVRIRSPTDVDVYSRTPLATARQIAVEQGGRIERSETHPGTWRVRRDGIVADVTHMPKRVSTIKIRGQEYVRTKQIEQEKLRAISKPELAYRHGKDIVDVAAIRGGLLLRKIRRMI